MLVLSRRLGEEIVIDRNIHVTVIAVNGDRVRLGVDAPPSIVVDRKEIHDRRPKRTQGNTTRIDKVADN